MAKLTEEQRADILLALDHLADAQGALKRARVLVEEIKLPDHNDSYNWNHEVLCTTSHAEGALNCAGNYLTRVHQQDVSWESWQDRIKRRNGGA